MPISGDYLDTITQRVGRSSGITFLGASSVKYLVTDLSAAWPPEKYYFGRGIDYVYIGNHYGFQFQLTFYLELKGSAIAPNVGFWEWKYLCDVDIVYPDGYTKSGTINLGSELIDPAVELEKVIDFPISFFCNITFDDDKRVTITEDGAYFYHPPFTTLDLYEKIPSGRIQATSVTVTGINTGTVADNTHVMLSDAFTSYDFTADLNIYSFGASAGIQPLAISNLSLNELAIPSYNYIHSIDANNYYIQTNSIDTKVQGTDSAFGTAIYNQIIATTSVTLERNIKNIGKVNSWQSSYPDALDVDIAKFDVTGRTVNFTGSFDESETYQKYSFNSNILLGITPNIQSLVFDNLPSGYIQNTIDSASLISNGDYQYATRLPFRGWWKPGADIYHEKNTVLSGSGNTRNVDYNFSGYRYLDITASPNGATAENGKLLVSWDGFQNILEKDLVWNPGSQTKRIDLCFAGIAHTLFADIQGQDNPYPRANFIWGNTVGAVQYNSDMYGIGQVKRVQATGNITVSQFKLTREDNTGKASFVAPFSTGQASAGTTTNGFTNWQTDSPTRSFWGRRFWEQDVSGKNEEEWDYGYEYFLTTGTGATQYALTVQGLCDNISDRRDINNVKIHTGWLASPSYNSGAVGTNESIYNKDAAYCSWLNGFGQQNIAGVEDQSILRDLSEESGVRDIYTQMIFDRLNCNYPPDYYDPFQLEAPGETELLLYSFSCLRSVAHGLVQEQQLGEIVTLDDTSGNVWGNGTTDILGSYQTGLPGGLPQNAGRIGYVTGIVSLARTFTAKRDRGAFYVIPVPVGVNILSADINGFYQGCIGTINLGDVDLIFSSTPDFSTFDTLSTNITGMSNVAIAWNHPTANNEMILVTQRLSDSFILRYVLEDFVNGVASMGSIIGSGSTPAIAINNNGTQIIVFRTATANVRRIIFDSAGNITTAASNVVVGNVNDNGLAVYWNDDRVFLVYDDTVNGLTVLSSDDYGQTFS
jgi:hypothetical protein